MSIIAGNEQREQDPTSTIVEAVMPRVIESVALAFDLDDSAALLDESRQIVINLLVLLTAVAQRQVSRTAHDEAAKLLKRALQRRSARTRLPAVVGLRSELKRLAVPCWGKLAPRLVRFARRSAHVASRDASDDRLRSGLSALLGISHERGGEKAKLRLIERVLERGVPDFGVRTLGSVHEALLARQLKFADGCAEWVVDRSRRKRSGSFYTPEPVVRWLLEATAGPVLRERLLQTMEPRRKESCKKSRASVTGFVLLDPAMGSGHFLTAALDYLAEHVQDFAARHQLRPDTVAERLCGLADGAKSTSRSKRRDALLEVKRLLANHALHGFDTDTASVELARLGLWLVSGVPARSVATLAGNLEVRDPLLSPPRSRRGAVNYDVVVGNPPYGNPPDHEYRARLRRQLPGTKSNADLAAAFVERSLTLVRPNGQVGLVLPKPLTYSYAWRSTRKALDGRVRWVCDLGRGWDEVLLEQTLVVFRRGEDSLATYRASRIERDRLKRLPVVPRAWSRRADVLLSGWSSSDVDRLRGMKFAKQTLGDLCRTFRGRPWQRRIDNTLVPSTGGVPLYGGRDLARWQVRSSSGSARVDKSDGELGRFRQEKLLFQNIVAHIERPQPHIRLIGTFDAGGLVTLDTVNNLVPRDGSIPLLAVLSLLHSEPVNWLLYRVVYNGAVRTMHFDQYFLDKIPLPGSWETLAPRLAELAKQCLAWAALAQSSDDVPGSNDTDPRQKLKSAESEIDRLVDAAYRGKLQSAPD